MSISQLVLRSRETRYGAHSKFSENTQTEEMVDGSGKPHERDSSNAQIRTLLEEQRQIIIAEYREIVSHHELQAARAEEERRLLQAGLWRQQKDFREVHQQSLPRWRNYENSKVLPSIRSQDGSSSRIKTLLWNYQEDYKNYKMK